jgi:predicted chitinase
VFSPDGKWIATISQDRTARLWDVADETDASAQKREYAGSVATFRGHVKVPTSVQFSADSKYLLTAGLDRTARVWDLSSLGRFAVDRIVFTANPQSYSGPCPARIKFTGEITVKGRSGSVTYAFLRSDGTSTLPQQLVFDGPGTKQVTDTHDTIAIPILGVTPDVNGWEDLEIVDPLNRISKKTRADFTVKCSNSESAGGKITDAQLQQIMPNSTAENRAAYLPSLQKALEEYGINTPAQRAAFLAEVAIITQDLKYLTQPGTDENVEKLLGMNKALGNFDPGDGARYRGRGAFMITGKTFYRSFGEQLGVDLIKNPEMLAAPEYAFKSATLLWQRNAVNSIVKDADITDVDRRIRGPYQRDLATLQSYFDRAKRVLTVGR